MGLPIEIFTILGLFALISLYLGFKNFVKDNGVSFLMIAGIIFIVLGLFVWTDGIQLPIVESMSISGETFIPSYVTLTTENANALWVLSYGLILGGLISIVVALGNTAGVIKYNREEKKNNREEFF